MNIKIEKCPFCGGTEFVKGMTAAQGGMYKVSGLGLSQTVYHIICKNCGSIVRSYLSHPEKLEDKK